MHFHEQLTRADVVMNHQKTFNLYKRDALFKKYGEPTNMEELARFVVNASNDKLPKREHIVGIYWEVRYGDVGCTHSAPIMGEQNWSGKLDLPRSYKGFSGRVWIRKKIENDFCSLSERIAKSYTYTGSGGGGAYNGPWTKLSHMHSQYHGMGRVSPEEKLNIFSWDYRMYADDFPFMSQFEEEIIISRLKDEKPPIIKSSVFWESEATKEQDDIFHKQFLLKYG